MSSESLVKGVFQNNQMLLGTLKTSHSENILALEHCLSGFRVIGRTTFQSPPARGHRRGQEHQSTCRSTAEPSLPIRLPISNSGFHQEKKTLS